MAEISALVVDDEPLARRKICDYLKHDREIRVVGQCSLGSDAVRAIAETKPRLVFLDVQMPDMTGFDVIEAVGAERFPAVVFVTAYDRHAVRAFEIRAIDYLLKPFSRTRFEKALERAKEQIRLNENQGAHIQALLQQLNGRKPYLERLIIKSSGTISFLRTSEIEWVQAEENYVRVHTGRTSHLVRQKIGVLEGQLDPSVFRRIHRSTIVNVDRIAVLQPQEYGDYSVHMQSGVELTLSRGYKARLKELFE